MDIADRAARDINLILTLDAKCKQQADEIERLQSVNEDIMKINARLRDEKREAANEIERLREHNKKMANVITDYCNEFIEEAPFYDEFRNALQQKEPT